MARATCTVVPDHPELGDGLPEGRGDRGPAREVELGERLLATDRPASKALIPAARR
jgi:hypothetical protein